MTSPTLPERLVREAIASQFPALRVGRARRLPEGGERAFEVNGELLFRFAADELEAAKLEREVALLRELSPLLPIAVPRYEYVGQPSDALPYPFAGYEKIAGRSGEAQRPTRERWPAMAQQFGAFLSALHAFPIERARTLGVPIAPEETFGAEYRTKDAGTLLARVRGFAAAIREGAPDVVTEDVERYLGGDVSLPSRSPLSPVLCHADLKGEHIIVSERRDVVAGVLDWTDATIIRTKPSPSQIISRAKSSIRSVQLTNRFYAPLELLKTQARWAFAGPG